MKGDFSAMLLNQQIWVGTSNEGPISLLPAMANRHGLIAGATGTGKTVTLQVLAEGFSALGVPVFMADVKGDLAGFAKPGQMNDKIAERLQSCRVEDFSFRSFPVTFWDVYGESGHPIRTTVSEMGPLLLSRMLGLNDTQTGVLHIIFRIADDENMLLLDLKDVKAMLAYVGENAGRYTLDYGNVAKSTVGAIQRAIAILEDQGGDVFFGEPALDIADWFSHGEDGAGMVNILSAQKLFRKPAMYSTFLLWLLGELYEMLPEQGDKALPRMVFFFDEAHLLFDDCSKTLLEHIEQVIRLIRSKGVGVYFITQNPADVPSSVLSQLSGRVQHALRAFTPKELKIVRSVAQTFRENPAFDTESCLTELATGEALLSFLQEDGSPSMVQRATILPPQSHIGTISDELRNTYLLTDAVGEKYDRAVDRESAYEMLSTAFHEAGAKETRVLSQLPEETDPPIYQPITFRVYNPKTGKYEESSLQTLPTPAQPDAPAPYQYSYPVQQPVQPVKETKTARKKTEKTEAEKLLEAFARSTVNSAGRELGRTLSRSLMEILGLKKKLK